MWKRAAAVTVCALATMVAPSAMAAMFYLSDCQAGAVPGCVPGNDANNGTTPETPWRSTARAKEAAKRLAAGDKILFARGGAWNEAALTVTVGKRHSNDKPFFVDSYKTAWSSDVRPILTIAPGAKALVSLVSENAAEAASGGIVRNLEFRGRDGQGVGVLIGKGVSDVVMDKLVVSGFSVGVQCSPGSHRVRLLHSKLSDNSVQGARWECDASQMEGTTLSDRSVVPDRLPAGGVEVSGTVRDTMPPAPPTNVTVQ